LTLGTHECRQGFCAPHITFDSGFESVDSEKVSDTPSCMHSIERAASLAKTVQPFFRCKDSNRPLSDRHCLGGAVGAGRGSGSRDELATVCTDLFTTYWSFLSLLTVLRLVGALFRNVNGACTVCERGSADHPRVATAALGLWALRLHSGEPPVSSARCVKNQQLVEILWTIQRV